MAASRSHPLQGLKAQIDDQKEHVATSPATTTTPSATVIHFKLTGFGPFATVTHNPTMTLIQELPAYTKQHPLPEYVVIDSADVIEVSTEGCHAHVNAASKAITVTNDHTPSITVHLHFGVHTGATTFNVEHCAYNNATFRVPDQRHHTPHNELIDKSRGILDEPLYTTLNVKQLVQQLQQQQYQAQESIDPGRFVCNYMYYVSLLQSKQHSDQHTLFCHCPPFDYQPPDTQVRFAYNLIKGIAEQLQTASAGGEKDTPTADNIVFSAVRTHEQ